MIAILKILSRIFSHYSCGAFQILCWVIYVLVSSLPAWVWCFKSKSFPSCLYQLRSVAQDLKPNKHSTNTELDCFLDETNKNSERYENVRRATCKQVCTKRKGSQWVGRRCGGLKNHKAWQWRRHRLGARNTRSPSHMWPCCLDQPSWRSPKLQKLQVLFLLETVCFPTLSSSGWLEEAIPPVTLHNSRVSRTADPLHTFDLCAYSWL